MDGAGDVEESRNGSGNSLEALLGEEPEHAYRSIG